ncbi:MAG: ATP-binding cassette domain-containing protein [Deltaproteobacteria bacterium]|nr:ATP-binding cassette domain-containing protein [Deltaproteobacteria bacterium]
MARVALVHLGKIYPTGAPGRDPNGVRALDDVTLEVADGELLVLVGPSGCGKSTVLRLVAGLEAATSGEIRIGDAVVNDLPPQARNVAMVFQDYALYPHMTVRRNLEFPLRMRGTGRAEIARRVETVAGQLDLAALLDRLPKQLSGGQRQRVAMGRALVREPAVSLLDEPLSNLDAKLRVEVRAEIAALQERTRTTMLYVTHDQVEAMTLGERVAVLHAGRLQQIATPRELYARPASAFVAGFIGNPPMNLLPGRLAADGAGVRVAVAGGTLRVAPEAVAHRPAGGAAEITVGIRPEALVRVDPGAANALRLTVAHVEWLGHETLAHLRATEPPGAGRDEERDDGMVARLPGMHQLAPGEPLALGVDPASVYLFDRNGRALG